VSEGLTLSVATCSPREAGQLGMMREALGGLAARTAAGVCTAGEATLLEGLVIELAGAVQAADPEATGAAVEVLHRAIALVSRNGVLARRLDQLQEMIGPLDVMPFTDPLRRRDALDAHREVVAAIAAGDAERAERAMRRHCSAQLRALTARPR
jgi:DNA-binding FadR family transcriptional regulator